MRMPPGISARWASRTVYFALTFGLYWLTSFVLEARNAMTHFGADAHVYTRPSFAEPLLARSSVSAEMRVTR